MLTIAGGNHLKYIVRAALGTNPAGRRLAVLPDDVFIVSYPRSGNTWTRFLIGNLLNPDHPMTFANVESRIPEIYFCSDRRLRGFSRPRVLKSHEYFDPRYKKVIYIVRDPRDVAVSTYHYSIKRRSIPEAYSLEEFVLQFVNGEFFEDFGTWEEHILSWYGTRKTRSGFLFVRYEDMLANPETELAKIASAMRVQITPKVLTRVVELSSSAHMQRLERKDSAEWKLTKGTRQDIPFVREAKSGGWRNSLPDTAVKTIEQAWGSTMKEFGYKRATNIELHREPVESGHV